MPDAKRWHGWSSVQGGRAAPGTLVTGVYRYSNHIDLFVVGTDGGIYQAWWDGASGWGGWQELIQGFRAAPGTSVTAIARNANQMDLFAVGTDGGIWSAWWNPEFQWSNWYSVQGGRAAPGTSVAVVSRNKNHMELFIVGINNVIQNAWYHTKSGWHDWSDVQGGRAAPGTSVAAFDFTSAHIDLYVIGEDGGIYHAWWENSLEYIKSVAFGNPKNFFKEFENRVAVDVEHPGLDWENNGCSGIQFKVNGVGLGYNKFFHDACLVHDFGYRNIPGLEPTGANRKKVDDAFLRNMLSICTQRTLYGTVTDTAAANAFYVAVRAKGEKYFVLD